MDGWVGRQDIQTDKQKDRLKAYIWIDIDTNK